MQPIDFSPTWLFSQATGVVQAVLIILALCSVACWAVILEKAVLLIRYKKQARGFDAWIQRDKIEAVSPSAEGLCATLLSEGLGEWNTPRALEGEAERRERTERAMRDAMTSELLRIETRLPYLATIGSAAPFIGLFGTVWGIMHAFVSIAQSGDTSLAVVAPGIAESLFTTAVGLAAAIPASIGYNKIASEFGVLGRRLSLSIAALVRRGLDNTMEAPDEAA